MFSLFMYILLLYFYFLFFYVGFAWNKRDRLIVFGRFLWYNSLWTIQKCLTISHITSLGLPWNSIWGDDDDDDDDDNE